MLTYTVRRLVSVLPVLMLVTLIVFTLNVNIPGDPGRLRLGQRADPAAVEAFNRERGYDDPFLIQYFRYLGRVAFRFDFGESDARSGVPVIDVIGEAFLVTLQLALAGIVISMAIGVTAGIISAVRSRSFFDYASMFLAVLGVSTPVFWLGIMMIIFLAQPLGLPISGYDKTTLGGRIESLVLPGVALGLIFSATIARLTRSAMLDVLSQDYVRTARAKGLPARLIILKHALKNAAIPIITVIGNSFAYLLVGAVLTETTFSLPGLGRIIVEAISQRDRAVITGGILFMALVFVMVNLVVDLTYALFDPRIRLGKE